MDRGVLLLTTDAETEAAVASALRGEDALTVRAMSGGGACRSLQELVTQLRHEPAKIVVVDLDPDPERMLSLLDPVISHFGGTRFVVMSRGAGGTGAGRERLIVDAMNVGARHVVAKDAIGTELAGILKRIAGNGSVRPGGLARGLLVAVLSGGGGCGATLLAVNLANELHLARKGGGGVLLVDMDEFSGAVGVYLGLESQYGLADVLADGERIDGELIRSTTAIYDSAGGGLHVLLNAGRGARAAGAMRYEYLPRLLEAAKSTFDSTVLDAPRLSGDVLQSVAAEAAGGGVLIVPFQLTVIGIRAAKNLLDRLGEAGCPADHVLPVATRYRKRKTMIGLDEAKKAVRRDDIGIIRNDFKAAVGSLNFGQPLSKSAPRSKLRADIQRLAAHLHAAHSSGQAIGTRW